MKLSEASAILPLIVLTMLAGFTFWLNQTLHENTSDTHSGTRHDPDYWADNFTLYSYNSAGALQHSLQAKHMEHFPDDDSAVITQPHIALLQNDNTITITAQSAELDAKGRHVQFRDDVRLVRTEPVNGVTTVDTRLLNVIPDDQYAQTDTPVTIKQGHSVIRAQGGMEINNKTQHLVLTGPVTGTIYRQPVQ
jgi:lipopolysaccharide export system protein LptC